MLHRNFVYGIVVALVLLVLVMHDVSGQGLGGNVQITNVDAPSTVVVGQPLTATITATVTMDPTTQYLVIEILDHTGAMGKPFPITASSCTGYTFPNESICSIGSQTIGNTYVSSRDLTVSFTLTAPDQAQFHLCVYALIYESINMNGQVDEGTSKILTVVTSPPVPEFPITELPILIICLTLISIIIRKQTRF